MRVLAFQRHGGQRGHSPPRTRRPSRAHPHSPPSRPHARKQIALEAFANGSRSTPAASAHHRAFALAQASPPAHGPNRHLSPRHPRARQTGAHSCPHPRHRRRKQRRHPRTPQHASSPPFPIGHGAARNHQQPTTNNQQPRLPFLPPSPS